MRVQKRRFLKMKYLQQISSDNEKQGVIKVEVWKGEKRFHVH